ncbi:Inosine-5'-monophosphate dehydrogenase [Hondaea fermentalgiana]|uniref:GMP reductase n=1 Tax=Hondaea fermentalgiana TaxID=2315210 RepID=A0A2R5GHT8_9STRA|nr:Inosine-5'-monophosphate dehydrogenase [Hondaea fermentalgiana]|eukprot:GBG30450.1 Inosine-5'-monophosphate dehydrogenase [Hondaea fermentalgiana]
MVRVETEVRLDFKDVLIRPKRSTLKSRSEVSVERTFVFKHSKQEWTGVPIMVANMDTTGTFEMATELCKQKVITCVHKHYTVEDWLKFAKENREALPYVTVSAGTSEADLEVVKNVTEQVPEVKMICLDVANGYSENFVATVRKVREAHPNHTIIAGNVVTGEMVEELILSGADIVKVGIGPGSVCTTRKQTGVGFPQLSAVLECSDSAHGLGGCVVSDGGCACPGDFAKALGAGADFVMSGGMFAGHDESGGELIEVDGKKVKEFYGMSSTTAMERHAGKVNNYRASEGKSIQVPYRGPVKATVLEILGGLRSACTYVGAKSLKEISKRTTFIRCTQQLNPVFNQQKETSKIPRSYLEDNGEPAAKKAKQ